MQRDPKHFRCLDTGDDTHGAQPAPYGRLYTGTGCGVLGLWRGFLTAIMSLEAIAYKRGRLRLLEQRKLPLELDFVDISGPQECHKAIYEMTVRGAPAIAISAALSLAVELVNRGSGAQFASTTQAVEHIASQLDYLVTRCDGAVA